MTSWVWKFFTALSSDKAKCNVCGDTIARKNYGTSAMAAHLRIKHNEMPSSSDETVSGEILQF
jgi:hypothetical protein